MSNISVSPPVLSSGWKGFKENWRNDLIAGLSVALVALPLSLAIASSAGVPPVFGLVSVVIGGLVTTFIRGSHIAINGPGAGIVSAILGALFLLNDGSGNVLGYVTAAIVVAGAIQVVLGLFRLGRLAEVFPSAVISGVLAAIGIIILVNQLDDMMGFQYSDGAQKVLQKVAEIPLGLFNLNPLIAAIGIVGLLIMIFYPKIAKHGLRFIPAPIWVMIIGVLAVFFLGFDEPFTYFIGSKEYAMDNHFLVQIPTDLGDMIMFPNFSRIGEPVFWLAVLPIFLIATIESLVSSKAVDKLDPFKRTTQLNRDLLGIGVSTMISGLLGGLPVVTVIARSSVNINNLGHSGWSNFFQGAFILIFVVLLSPLIQMVPLSALGAILVFTGFKLAGPYVYKHAYQLGWEQLFFLLITIISTLVYNLVTGLLIGMGVTLLYHIIVSRLPISLFFGYIYKFPVQTQIRSNGDYLVRIKGVANFITNLKIKNTLELIPKGKNVVLQLSKVRLIDLTVMESLHEFARNYQNKGGSFHIEGYEMHDATSNHPTALRVIPTSPPKPLSRRQHQLKDLAITNGWTYRSELDWNNSSLQSFQFFNHRPIEYKENVINGKFEDLGVDWEIADITFDEGALQATEVYHNTVEILHLPYEVPSFMLEKEGKLDKVFDIVRRFVGRIDIDFEEYPDFSNHFLLEGPDEAAIRKLFNPALLQFLQENEIYHIESAQNKLLIFRKLRLAKTEEIGKMLIFCYDFVSLLEPVRV